ncbi:MAG: hypothetical protein R3F30_03065 [Planctomycetota bacterium]
MRIPVSLLALSLLAVPATAQTQTFLISPKAGATNGNTNNNIPYSWTPTRYQQVYDADSFDVTTPIASSQLYYRMNSSFANGSYGGQTVELAVWLAYTASGIDSQTASTTFASNLDNASLKNVIKKTKVFMPKLSNTNWDIKLPFDSGVTFLYGVILKKNLVIETRVYSNTNNSSIFTYPLDAMSLSSQTPGGTVVQNGTYNGCKSSNAAGSVVTHDSVPARLFVGSGTNYHFGNGYVQSAPAVLTIGATALSATLPGTSCTIVNDILLLAVGTTDTSSNGLYSQPLPIPNDNNLANVSYLTQMFFLDGQANSVGLTASRGLRNTIGAAVPGSITRLYGFATDPDTVTTGSVGKNYGLMTRLSN